MTFNPETRLSNLQEMPLRMLYYADQRLRTGEVVVGDSMRWPTQDVLMTICSKPGADNEDRFLIGKLRAEHEFCPGSWDVLTKHVPRSVPGESLAAEAMTLPSQYANVLGVRMVGSYNRFLWPNSENKVWWNFLPFRVETMSELSNGVVPNKAEKYSQFYWAAVDEFKQYDRLGYLDCIKRNTIDRYTSKISQPDDMRCHRCDVRRS